MKEKQLWPRERIKGVLFDFDGTLTRPGAIDFSAMRREIHCPEDQTILEYIETLPPGRRARFEKLVELREDHAADKSVPNGGAERCLSELRQKGIPLGILTRNRLKTVCRVLEKFKGISEKDFAAIITREDALPKPHPDGVYQAAGRMGLRADQLMVVGDFRFDILAGKAAGAFTVLLTNHHKPHLAPGDPEPDHMTDRLEGILTLLSTNPKGRP